MDEESEGVGWSECINTVFHDAVQSGEEFSHDQCLRCRARKSWNAVADRFNRWPALAEDEKQLLIQAEAHKSGGNHG